MSKRAEERRKAGWKARDVPTTRSHIRAVRKAPLLRTGAFLLTLTKCLSTNWIQATSCAYCITRYITAAFDLLIFAVHCPSFLLRSFYVALWTTHVTDTDWRVCSWPWLLLFLREPRPSFACHLMCSNLSVVIPLCFYIKNLSTLISVNTTNWQYVYC
jgi:hypothetical protein